MKRICALLLAMAATLGCADAPAETNAEIARVELTDLGHDSMVRVRVSSSANSSFSLYRLPHSEDVVTKVEIWKRAVGVLLEPKALHELNAVGAYYVPDMVTVGPKGSYQCDIEVRRLMKAELNDETAWLADDWIGNRDICCRVILRDSNNRVHEVVSEVLSIKIDQSWFRLN